MQRPTNKKLGQPINRRSTGTKVIETATGSSPSISPPQRGSKKLKRDDTSLNTIEANVSILMHHKTISDLFTVIDMTIGRTSGVLGAAVLFAAISLLGPICYGYLGYEYSYALNVAGLIIGYFLGLCVELLFKFAKKLRS